MSDEAIQRALEAAWAAIALGPEKQEDALRHLINAVQLLADQR